MQTNNKLDNKKGLNNKIFIDIFNLQSVIKYINNAIVKVLFQNQSNIKNKRLLTFKK